MTPIQKKLEEAREYASQGETEKMDDAVLIAYKIAQKLGRGINHEEVKEFMRDGYINSISNDHETTGKEQGDIDLIMGVAWGPLQNAARQYEKIRLLEKGNSPYNVARAGKPQLQKP